MIRRFQAPLKKARKKKHQQRATGVEAEPAEPEQRRAQGHEGHVVRLFVVVLLILWDLSTACLDVLKKIDVHGFMGFIHVSDISYTFIYSMEDPSVTATKKTTMIKIGT